MKFFVSASLMIICTLSVLGETKFRDLKHTEQLSLLEDASIASSADKDGLGIPDGYTSAAIGNLKLVEVDYNRLTGRFEGPNGIKGTLYMKKDGSTIALAFSDTEDLSPEQYEAASEILKSLEQAVAEHNQGKSSTKMTIRVTGTSSGGSLAAYAAHMNPSELVRATAFNPKALPDNLKQKIQKEGDPNAVINIRNEADEGSDKDALGSHIIVENIFEKGLPHSDEESPKDRAHSLSYLILNMKTTMEEQNRSYYINEGLTNPDNYGEVIKLPGWNNNVDSDDDIIPIPSIPEFPNIDIDFTLPSINVPNPTSVIEYHRVLWPFSGESIIGDWL